MIDREIPGFGELMRHSGRASTPLASLSRGAGGSIGRNGFNRNPAVGSPKGALESLNAILELVPTLTCTILLNGRTAHRPELTAGCCLIMREAWTI